MPRYSLLGKEKSRTITVRLTEEDLSLLKAYQQHLNENRGKWVSTFSLSGAVREAIRHTESLNLDKSTTTA